MAAHVTDRLIARIQETGAPVCVGLDPRLQYIPECVKKDIYTAKGKTPEAAADIFLAFNMNIIDHIYDIVPVVKPQIAMYEQLGPPGIACFIKTVAYARQRGLYVISDAKRGDITGTVEAYSAGFLGEVDIEGTAHGVFQTDYLTVNPYIGYDCIEAFLHDCEKYDRGLFVLVKTSNPQSSQIQDIITNDGRPVYAHIGGLVSEWGKGMTGEYGFSRVGAVVGATHPAVGRTLREAMPHTFFLSPGYGAQGATAKDLRGLFNKDGIGAIINSSRGITGAGTDKYYGEAAREAALKMIRELRQIL